MGEESIVNLFEACDLNGSGYIEEEDFHSVCGDLSLQDGELDQVFRELDCDHDGKISLSDFTQGFQSVQSLFLRKRFSFSGSSPLLPGQCPAELAWDAFNTEYSKDLNLISSQEQVCELYQQLHASEVPQLLAHFENIIIGVTKDLKSQQSEVTRLEKTLRRSNEMHQDHLKQLEDEMDAQMLRLEQRIRQEERENAEVEKFEIRRQMEDEISELQANLKRFHKLENRFQRDTGRDEALSNLRKQVEELMQENRHLRSNLTETQTDLALVRTELDTVQSTCEEQRGSLSTEKGTLMEYAHEQENLTRQLHLLQEVNKKLHDTNDDLRAALESSKQTQKRSIKSIRAAGSRGSFMSDYIDEELPNDFVQTVGILSNTKRGSRIYGLDFSHRKRPRSTKSSRASSIEDDSLLACDPQMRGMMAPYQRTLEDWDVDSGNSTLRDPNEDSEYEANSIDEDIRVGSPARYEDDQMQAISEAENCRDDNSMETDVTVIRANNTLTEPMNTPRRASPTLSVKSVDSRSSRPGSGRRRALPQIPLRAITPSTAMPERMYKVVMAGDAAVGKSSFILRLCKGIFHNNLNSTLGVDFQMKTLEVDQKLTTIQLWDTAGQERFRSIAKSYFRRADGVLLLYDVTFERSFINVRDWIEAIADGAQKELPIVMCGNKTDARAETTAKGIRCISTEEGEKLAKAHNALFLETSAKEGDGIIEAVTELARRLHEREDLEVQEIGMKLGDDSMKKKDSKCCNM
uniref:Ras and EF-hand domain-containing protein homolog isoform X2 n=1 Tax=Saccoglossus kowalevskii TaxID=10224 RepID=A0ABM0LX35_SACKO|nr:PREDICTED: ras and EF-hand domain-containing protein homolog isoform X2 [Saccoglossus kowalevskii]